MVHPIPPRPGRHQSGEPASDPVSLIIPCSCLVHHLRLSQANPQLLTWGYSQSPGRGIQRAGYWKINICTHTCTHRSPSEQSLWAPSVCASRNTSVSRRDTVSEWGRATESGMGGRWRMLCELCCSFNQCWASAQRQCASVSVTNSLIGSPLNIQNIPRLCSLGLHMLKWILHFRIYTMNSGLPLGKGWVIVKKWVTLNSILRIQRECLIPRSGKQEYGWMLI